MAILNWFFDFHSHPAVHIGRQPAVADIARQLVDAGVTEMSMFAKGHCGFTFYPTALSHCYAHPRMTGDPLGSVVQACVDQGLSALAYISFGIDGYGGQQNPHWIRHGPQGRMTCKTEHFTPVCPYSPYTEESILPQVDEVLARYPVAGFFFDTMSALAPCYCPWCTRDWLATHDQPLPMAVDDEAMGCFGQWRHDRSMNLLARISQFIQDRRPGAIVAFNQVGCLPVPQPMPPGCTRLSLDFTTKGPQSRQASCCAAFGSTAPLPADVMPTIFNGGWGDWSLAPAQRLKQVAAAIWSRKGRAYFGDRLHPQVSLAQPSVEALQILGCFKKEFEQHAPPADATLMPDILILHGSSMQYGRDYRWFSISEQTRLGPLKGAAALLLDAGCNYSICADYCLDHHLDQAGLVILPQLESIDPATERQLHDFVTRGGQILIVGQPPLVNDAPLSWAGVTCQSQPWQDHIYLSLPDDQDAAPVLVRGQAFHTKAQAGSDVILHAIAPLDMAFGISLGWGISPPSDQASDSAALVHTAVGKGAVWTLPTDLFTAYHEHAQWGMVALMAQLCQRILPQPRMSLNSPHGQIEAILQEQGDKQWVNLVNHAGETYAAGTTTWPRTWGPLPALPITLHMRSPSGERPANVTLQGKAIDHTFNTQRKQLTIPLVMDQVNMSVCVDWS